MLVITHVKADLEYLQCTRLYYFDGLSPGQITLQIRLKLYQNVFETILFFQFFLAMRGSAMCGPAMRGLFKFRAKLESPKATSMVAHKVQNVVCQNLN